MNQAFYALATLQAFFSDRLDNRKDRGATAVEYGLMVGLIAVLQRSNSRLSCRFFFSW